MPLIDINDPLHLGIVIGAEGDTGHPNTRNEVRLVYARYHVIPILRERWAWLVPLLGLTPASSVCIIGAGYGYSIEVLAEMGITRVIGTEPATALHAKASQSEDADIRAQIEAVGLTIASGRGAELWTKLRDRPGQARCSRAADLLAEDMSTGQSRARVRQALMGKGGTSWDVVTENVATVLSDAECVTLSGRARQLQGINRLIHLVSTTNDGNIPGYNWKTAVEWGTLLPNDTFISIYTREVAGRAL